MKKAITVSCGGEVFGFFMEDVKEVVNCPKVFPVPKAPEYVKGIANLRGECLPIVSLARLLWDRDEEGKKVLISQVEGEAVGFLVAEVERIIEVREEDLRDTSALGKEVNKRYISKVYSEDDNLVAFLNVKKLVGSGTRKGERRKKAAETVAEGRAPSGTEREANGGISVLIFQAGGDLYGVSVSEVKEIVEYPERVVPVPSAPPYVLGLFSIRGKVIPLISIGRFLGSESKASRGRVIVLQKGGAEVGLEADSANEIRKVREGDIMPPPSCLDPQHGKILQGIIKLDGGKRLVHFLDPEPFVELHGVTPEEGTEGEEMQSKEHEQKRMFVWFSLGSDPLALPIEVVKEAVNAEQIIPVPKAPEFVQGVMNLRGEVLPIISLAKLLELDVDPGECRRVIVTHLGETEAGLLVKEIKGILRVSQGDISPLGEVAREAAQAFSGAIKREGGLILIINIERLLGEAHREKLRVLKEEGGGEEGQGSGGR